MFIQRICNKCQVWIYNYCPYNSVELTKLPFTPTAEDRKFILLPLYALGGNKLLLKL